MNGARSGRPPDRGGAPDETVVIAAGADERFALGLTVALTSALRALEPGRPAHVYVMDGGLTPASARRCGRALAAARPDATVTFIEPDLARLAQFRIKSPAISHAAYLRLLLPEVVAPGHRRVLYLDSDVVVLADVAGLWALPEDGTPLRAVDDVGLRGRDYIRAILGIDAPGAPYFNTGVLLIDLGPWRQARVSERAEAWLDAHGHVGAYHDQDALNAVSVGAWERLPEAWNVQVNRHKLRTVLAPGEAPAIVHYLNGKPWDARELCAFQDVFDAALAASGWFGPLGFAAWHTPRRLRRLGLRLRSARMLDALRPLRGGRRRAPVR